MNQDIISRLKNLSPTLLADVMDFENVMDYKIKPVTCHETLVGQARTVSVYPGDNLYIHHGIYKAKPGEILVVEGRGATVSAYIGNLMAAAAEKVGISGIIIDGLVRDKKELSKMNIQVYTKGFSPMGPRKNGPGSFDQSIQCGGVVVRPYDFIIADEDGVVVVPYQDAEKYIIKAEEKLGYEEKRLEKINTFNLNSNKGNEVLQPYWLREAFDSEK